MGVVLEDIESVRKIMEGHKGDLLSVGDSKNSLIAFFGLSLSFVLKATTPLFHVSVSKSKVVQSNNQKKWAFESNERNEMKRA
jgi:hypothetical protein